MSSQGDFFKKDRYPEKPGSKKTDTSRAAARVIAKDVRTLRNAAYKCILERSGTSDEIAGRMGLSRLTIRPRISELRRKRLVRDSGVRRKNDSGKNAIVWEVREDKSNNQ